MRAFLIFLAVVALATLSWMLFDFTQASDESLSGGVAIGPEESVDVRRDQGVSKVSVPRSKIEDATKANQEQPASSKSETAEVATMSGRVFVSDREGNRFEKSNGRFLINAYGAPNNGKIEAVVKDGRWTAPVKPGMMIQLNDIVLDDKPARPREFSYRVPDADSLDLHFTFIETYEIHVQSREDRQHLSGVEIIDLGFSHPGHPGLKTPKYLVQDKQSPISVTGWRFVKTLGVRAPGFAWKKLVIRTDAPRVHTVILERAGSLKVDVAGAVLPKGCFLRIYENEVRAENALSLHGNKIAPGKGGNGQALVEIPLKDKNSFVIENLNPGLYEALVEFGKKHLAPVKLGGTYAHVEAEDASDITVVVDLSALPKPGVPVIGRLEVDKSWGALKSVGVRVKPLRLRVPTGQPEESLKLKPVEGVDSVWTFETNLIPGKYEAVIGPFENHQLFEVPENGVSNLVFSIGPRIEVAVTVLKPDGTKAGKDALVTWNGKIPAGVSSYSSMGANYSRKSEAFKFFCSEGNITVSASLAGFRDVSQTLMASATKTELTLTLKSTQGVSLELKYKAARIPVDWDFTFDTYDLNGKRVHEQSSVSDGMKLTHHLKPGRYRVKLGKLDGYRAIPDQEIEVKEGEVTPIVIELEREQ